MAAVPDSAASSASAARPVKRKTSVLTDLLAGSLGGMAGKLIEHPFDTLKVRLQTAYGGASSLRSTPSGVLSSILSLDGIRGLYRGMSLPLAGTVLETATLFTANGYLKRQLAASGKLREGEHLPLKFVVAAGAGTGFCVSWVLTPIELVKCRLQVSGQPMEGVRGGYHPSYLGPYDCISRSLRAEGVRVFYRGHMGTLLREIPGTACWFAAYEMFLRRFAPTDVDRSDLHPAAVITAGACGGMSYWAVMYPADTVKSAMQTAAASQQPLSFSGTARQIFAAGGVRALYAGATPTMLRAAPSNAAIFLVYEWSLKHLSVELI